MTEQSKTFKFFVDGRQYEVKTRSINGATIKTTANVPAPYQLFLEEEGDTPDKPVADSEVLDLEGREKHFFAVPPATFG